MILKLKRIPQLVLFNDTTTAITAKRRVGGQGWYVALFADSFKLFCIRTTTANSSTYSLSSYSRSPAVARPPPLLLFVLVQQEAALPNIGTQQALVAVLLLLLQLLYNMSTQQALTIVAVLPLL